MLAGSGSPAFRVGEDYKRITIVVKGPVVFLAIAFSTVFFFTVFNNTSDMQSFANRRLFHYIWIAMSPPAIIMPLTPAPCKDRSLTARLLALGKFLGDPIHDRANITP